MQIVPRARWAMSHWLFGGEAYWGMLRRRAVPRGTPSTERSCKGRLEYEYIVVSIAVDQRDEFPLPSKKKINLSEWLELWTD